MEVTKKDLIEDFKSIIITILIIIIMLLSYKIPDKTRNKIEPIYKNSEFQISLINDKCFAQYIGLSEWVECKVFFVGKKLIRK